jgi:hypothetical protein
MEERGGAAAFALRRRRWAMLAPMRRFLVGVAFLLASSSVRAEVDRNIFRDATVGIEIVFPADWAVSGQPSYPYLLASAIDRTLGGRMTLSLERLRANEKVRDCAERNHAVLKKLGFKAPQQQAISQHPTGAVILEMVTPDGRKLVRQAYRQFEDKGPVFVLTLAAPRETMQRYRRAFDDSLRGLTRTAIQVPKPLTPAPAPEEAPTR